VNASRSARSIYAQAAAVCACNSLRRASRAVTQLFDQTLEPSGLRSTQLVILLEIAAAGRATVPELARRLVVDRSTMQRNLQPLMRRRFIQVSADQARRSRGLTLTPQGHKAIDLAVPLWKKAQSSFVSQLGRGRWELLRADLSAAVLVAKSDPPEESSRPRGGARTRTVPSRPARTRPRGR